MKVNKLHFQCTVGNVFQGWDVTVWPHTSTHINWKSTALKLVLEFNVNLLVTFQSPFMHIHASIQSLLYVCIYMFCVSLMHDVCVLLVCI